MDNYINNYLQLTRGLNSFKESKDDVIEALVHCYAQILQQNRIKVVVIWSVLCKNEIIKSEDGSKVLIWDTNYWTRFAEYYHHMKILDTFSEEGASRLALEIQADAAWRDLFRVAFPRVKRNNLDYQLFFTKYYLSYGTRILKSPQISRQCYFDIANAKLFAFLHEVGHLTSQEYINEYKQIIRVFFKDLSYYKTLLLEHVDPSIRNDYSAFMDYAAEQVNQGKFELFNEIIADMRAICSICTTFSNTQGLDDTLLFTKLRAGIAYLRSFNLRVRTIETQLNSICNTYANPEHLNGTMLSQHFFEFLLRDQLVDFLDCHAIEATFRGIDASKIDSFIDAYTAEEVYTKETASTIGNTLYYHLEKIDERLNNSNLANCKKNTVQSKEIIEYLLSYPSEENDVNTHNCPIEIIGWNGLFLSPPIN